MKPFYRSRKFAYALSTFLASALLMLLPTLVELDEATAAMLDEYVPLVVAVGVLLILGHTVTDVTALLRDRPVRAPLDQAAHELIDAVAGGEEAPSPASITVQAGTVTSDEESSP